MCAHEKLLANQVEVLSCVALQVLQKVWLLHCFTQTNLVLATTLYFNIVVIGCMCCVNPAQ